MPPFFQFLKDFMVEDLSVHSCQVIASQTKSS